MLREPADIAACRPGDVVVMRHPTIGAAVVAVSAAALVCETGGVLNHLAVLAREVGLPCVTGVPGIVNALESGADLRVDGTRGFIDAPAPRPQPPAMGAMVPLLRFGRFSSTFACEQAVLTPDSLLHIAPLVRLPVVMGCGGPLEIVFEGNRVLTDRRRLRRLGRDLAALLDAGTPSAETLRATYEEDTRRPCWEGTADDARQTVASYVRMNHITGVAALAKEDLASRLRARLAADSDDAGRGDEEFLRSLTTSGVSRLLTHTTRQPNPALAVDTGRSAEVRARVRAITDLVTLTERRNADLVRCAAVMGRVPLAATLGLPSIEDDGTDEGRHATVRDVSAALGDLERWR